MPQQTTIEPPRSNSDPPTVPSSLESPRAKLIWMTVATYGPLSITELCQAIDVPRLTLYPHLNALEDEDLVHWNHESLETDEAGAGQKQ